MLIRFHGADRTVTGSCHIVETNGLRILLDFGLFQGAREESRLANSILPDDLKHIDAVILSHGHLDHCGRLPLLCRAGFRGPIFSTPATRDVARIVMLDAAKIQEEDATYLNRRSALAQRSPVKPLFTSDDVQCVLPRFHTVAYDIVTEIGKGVRFTFRDAGHILGSAYIILESDEENTTRRLLFTGDIGRYGTPIIRDPAPLPTVGTSSTAFGGYDAVITESTYGNVKHAPMSEVPPQLLKILQEAIARKGRVILPSFAVGRTQSMLYYIQRFIQAKQIPEIPIFVDSPMGAEVSRVTATHASDFDDETREAIGSKDLFGSSHVTFTVTGEESRRINNVSGAAVIIASSPTCEFGRVLHHLKRSIENPDDTVVFVGYTPANTLGRRLQNGAREIRILDRIFHLQCRVRTLHGLSAHADGDELLRFLKPAISRGSTAYVVHGEPGRCDAFAARLSAAGFAAAIAPSAQSTATVGLFHSHPDPTPTATDE